MPYSDLTKAGANTAQVTTLMKILVVIFLFANLALSQQQTLGSSEKFSTVKLSATEMREIIAGVEKSAYDTPASWGTELRVTRVDLGSGPGIVVRGTKLLCGGTGNCQIWIFHRVNGRWVSLFDDLDDPAIAEGFQLGPAVTQGIKDLTITANLSAESGKQTTYKFDGRVYRAK